MRLGFISTSRVVSHDHQLVVVECHALVLHPRETTSPTSLVWVIRVMISEPSPPPVGGDGNGERVIGPWGFEGVGIEGLGYTNFTM